MDNLISTLILSCSVTATLFYGWRILNWLWFTPRSIEKRLRQQGFRGNPYRFFYGDLRESSMTRREARSKAMVFSHDIVPRVIPSFHKAITNHGENCFVWFGPKPALLVMVPEIIREIMSKNYVFQKPRSPLTTLLAGGLLSLERDEWAKHRRLINPAFHAEKLKHMVPAFHLSCGEMLSKWDEIVGSNEGCCEVDVWPYLQTMTSDVISRTAFGSSYEQARKMSELQREQAKHIMEAHRSVHIPGYRFLPTRFNRRMKETKSEIESILLGMIKKRLKAMEEETYSNDLLGLLLESNFKEHGNDGLGMSIEEVIEECKLFYFAGHETTASLLVWMMILLSKHGEWQDRARDEVLQVFGRAKPNFQELNHLKIVSMILHEALRLYPPVPVLARTHHEECRFGRVSIPAGVQLILPAILLHHDPKIWGHDATEVKPERFNEGVEKAVRGQTAYFPFGWGPRICIGQKFAMLETKTAMAMILQRYSFQLSSSYSHAPHPVITLQPQYGAHLMLTKL
ncbi:cytochrome P450 CYP72A219-like [Salvia hispanica]|uniref:cytochrome P450 CYP72A219-like n=1 Tax=Salvia hispanica TaxID=49212 RepID=UPI002009B02C|nr:cytochrome P450 CYP72A219-like [Salvia hispanica]